MINKERLTNLFIELTAIDSPTFDERAMLDRLLEKFRGLGIFAREDDRASAIGSTAGNLYAYVEGDDSLPPILLSAHMDTVEPSKGKKAIPRPDGKITSDGRTVLGADDVSGIAVILETLTVLKESGLRHRPIEILFDAAEEAYCAGIKKFDLSTIKSREAYIFDLSGPVGRAAFRAPSILSFRMEFRGRAAHAAFSSENGIHAIKAAADAVANIHCGRVDDVTVNVGTIKGGDADNIVPDNCVVTGEVRGFSDEAARKRLSEIQVTARYSAEKYGAESFFETKTLCVAYRVDKDTPVAKRFLKACEAVGLNGELVSTYGGSDNNYLVNHGIPGLVVAAGMNDCHSRAEFTSVSELERAANLALALVLTEEAAKS